MKTLPKILILFILLGSNLLAADIFDDITNSIRGGDASQLSKHFNNNVDLTIINQEEVYSKAQAEMVIKNFFAKNTPKSFTIIHQGASKEGAQYVIGTLTTLQGASFRTYLFVKKTSNVFTIQELRFEKE